MKTDTTRRAMSAPSSAQAVKVPIEHGILHGNLVVPAGARRLVVFVHGSGSSRHSPRNQRVAGIFNDNGLATMLCDLLTESEEQVDQRTAELRFDIDLLTRRVGRVITWTRADDALAALALGLFGASTGAAAALAAAAIDPDAVDAVVSRGGRPDLAGDLLPRVQAPTLLIVGARDLQVLELNQHASSQLHCRQQTAIVPGASHLFEEPGTLEQVAKLATSWFLEHLASPDTTPPAPKQRTARAVGNRASGRYANRVEAGAVLAQALSERSLAFVEPIVVALPRGGVPVAIPVARLLAAPLHITVTRKIGVPEQPELALGAVDEDGNTLFNEQLMHSLQLSQTELQQLVGAAHAEAQQRADLLRDGGPPAALAGHDVILVDDGYATGMTARAAARYLKRHGARHVTLAVPVAPRVLLDRPPEEFDRVVCPYTPRSFRAVGFHYDRFDQVDDTIVREPAASAPGGRDGHCRV
jgi:predicted phosphoribosyltransferase/dienelactone hydrolase